MGTAKLLAVVCFTTKTEQVKCGHAGCKHYVYRRIHVVEDEGTISLLGSTCFAKKYQGKEPLGAANFGGGGEGRILSAEERELLLQNTAALIARFEAERKVHENRAQCIPASTTTVVLPAHISVSGSNRASNSPWPWQKLLSSTWYILLADGSGWVRVQHANGKHLLVPWPVFDGWDEALPPQVGEPSEELNGYVLSNVPAALDYLRARRDWESKAGRWRDVQAEISARKKASGKGSGPFWPTA